tara:strand:- start:312 stop:1781 length:1470 start_codon:yes stop_codon:yes gene_type:complete
MQAVIAPPPDLSPRDDVRRNIRGVLASEQAFNQLDPDIRRDVARALVQIGSAALNLAEQSAEAPTVSKAPIATAQSSAPGFGAATDRLAQTTRDTLEAVSFPRFVSELITGVFKAMNDSNQQQLTSFVELIRNVAASTDGFADANVGEAGARQWLAERFPGSFMVQGAEEDDDMADNPAEMTAEERAELQAERDAETRLVLRSGGSFPTEDALRVALGVASGESIPSGNPEGLVPLARRSLAKNRQEMLATMVQMGLQRIVIESGRLNASMKFHIDTSSASNDDRGSRFDMRNTVEAGAKYGVGPWGAEAKVQNTIGYVTTERTQTSEEINTELNLDSGVELIFKTDYVPLDRLASSGDRERIRVNTINPEAEAQRVAADRTARSTARATDRTARRSELNSSLTTPAAPAQPSPINIPDSRASAPATPAAPRAASPAASPAAPRAATPAASPSASRTGATPTATPTSGGTAPATVGTTPPATTAPPTGR